MNDKISYNLRISYQINDTVLYVATLLSDYIKYKICDIVTDRIVLCVGH